MEASEVETDISRKENIKAMKILEFHISAFVPITKKGKVTWKWFNIGIDVSEGIPEAIKWAKSEVPKATKWRLNSIGIGGISHRIHLQYQDRSAIERELFGNK